MNHLSVKPLNREKVDFSSGDHDIVCMHFSRTFKPLVNYIHHDYGYDVMCFSFVRLRRRREKIHLRTVEYRIFRLQN